MERIQKILAQGGIASRRAAEALIAAGRVRVNGRIITEPGTKADPRKDKVEVDGKRVIAEDFVYLVIHKPRGVVSTMSDPEGRPTVRELINGVDGRIYPVGRLDFATSGVLLATNDGELADGLLHPRKTVPKTYVLKVKGVMSPEDLDAWRKGVKLEDGMTAPADAKLLRHEADKTWFELTIREGRNQQIRRMGEATGFPVMRLARLAFAEISAEGLAPGRWRHLTREELQSLKKTYGVPRSIPSAGALAQLAPTAKDHKAQRTVPSAVRGAAGRTKRAFGKERPVAPPPREGSRASREARPGTEDWGGGAGRGAGRTGGPDAPRGDVVAGGRSSRARTPGTAASSTTGASARAKGRRPSGK